MTATRIAHISDIHLPPLPSALGRLSLKQFLGYLSWQGKRRFRHDEKVLEALKQDLGDIDCDHICVCGDQTNLGTESEYRQATLWLQDLGEAENISVVPGNHDAYSQNYQSLINTYWLPWMVDRDSHNVGLPFVRQEKDVCIIGLSSAMLTKPFMADGKVSTEQREELDHLLSKMEIDNCFRVLMIPHPPILGMAKWRKALRDTQKIQHYLEKLDVDVVLHGHLHKPTWRSLVFGHKRVPVLGTASASSNGKGIPSAQYFVLDIEKIGENWNMQVRSREYDPHSGTFRDVDLPTEEKDQDTAA